MTISSMFHTLIFLMAMLIFSMPFAVLAQENLVQAKVVSAAEADAEGDIKKITWFSIGCFGSIYGLIYAFIEQPVVPAHRLLGKSPEYVTSYTLAYTEKAKDIQARQATLGCITSGCIGSAIGYAIVAPIGVNLRKKRYIFRFKNMCYS